jgi:NAD(P)-dependent dehydrogenase (short-subunit alcohol dehydrogenase family)
MATQRTATQRTATQRTILITGSTDGVGRRVAQRLAQAGTTLLIHGRDAARGSALEAQLREAGSVARFYAADLSSLREVRRLAQAVQSDQPRLDVLINNAGIGTGKDRSVREVSIDGYELRFAVNYLSGFLLTHLLLPLLKASQPSRIVNVASIGQQAIDFSDVLLTRGYDGRRAYCQSKLAQILFTFELAQELQGSGVTVSCLHPATYMDTTMVRASGLSPLSSVDDGAEAILNLAVSPELAGKTGLYYDRLRPSRADDQAYDAAARAHLGKLSRELTGL